MNLNRLSQRVVASCTVIAVTYASVVTHAYANSNQSAKVPAESLFGKVIVVDPGHGGPDTGARGVDGVIEKDVALNVSNYLTDYLRQGGALVYMTRTTDVDFATEADRRAHRRHAADLQNRYNVVESKHPDMFISIHCNAASSSAWYGATTIYMKGNASGKRLAELTQASFRQYLLPTRRSADDMSTLFLLRHIDGPAMLAEIGFVTNPNEAAHLRTTAYQKRVAMAIYLAAVHYYADPPVTPKAPPTRSGV